MAQGKIGSVTFSDTSERTALELTFASDAQDDGIPWFVVRGNTVVVTAKLYDLGLTGTATYLGASWTCPANEATAIDPGAVLPRCRLTLTPASASGTVEVEGGYR